MDKIMTQEELIAMKLHESKIVNQDSNSSIIILRVVNGWIYTTTMRVGATSIFVPEIPKHTNDFGIVSKEESLLFDEFKEFVIEYGADDYSVGDAHDILLDFSEKIKCIK